MLGPLIDSHAREVTADKGYDTDANHQRLKGRPAFQHNHQSQSHQPGDHRPGQSKSQRERPNIERKFAEQKKYHGLAKARYWSLAKVTIQVLMTSIVVNCKKIAKLVNNRLSKLPARPAGAYT